MASQALPLEEAVQILQDAGCTEEFTQRFISAMEAEPIQAQLRLLQVQRKCQLDQVHVEEKKLDCLDYLRYVLEKQLPADAKPGRKGH